MIQEKVGFFIHMNRCFCYLIILVVLGGGPSCVWADEALLKEVEKLLEEYEKASVEEKNVAFRELEQGVSSSKAALKLYEKALFHQKFEGGRGDSGKFLDWKRKNESKLDDRIFRQGLVLHLRFILLSLEYADILKLTKEDEKEKKDSQFRDLIADLLNYVNDVENLKDKIADERSPHGDFLRVSLKDSVIIAYLDMQGALKNLKNWPGKANQSEAFFSQTILPYYRKKKDLKLFEMWDRRIELIQNQIKRQKTDQAIEDLEFKKIPQLEWERAWDTKNLKDQNQGIREMISILKANSAHPNFKGWAKSLIEELKKETQSEISEEK